MEEKVLFFLGWSCRTGSFYESLNFAVVKKIPTILYVIQPLLCLFFSKERQPENRKNYNMARAIGIKSFSSNGNNVLECYKNFKKAIQYKSIKTLFS